MRKVKIQLTQPQHDADGNVVHQPGEMFDEGDRALKDLPPGTFKAVIVDDSDQADEKADDKPAAAASKPAVSGKSA